jgi:hypothetical protein
MPIIVNKPEKLTIEEAAIFEFFKKYYENEKFDHTEFREEFAKHCETDVANQTEVMAEIKGLRADIQAYNDLINKGKGALWIIGILGGLVWFMAEFGKKILIWIHSLIG